MRDQRQRPRLTYLTHARMIPYAHRHTRAARTRPVPGDGRPDGLDHNPEVQEAVAREPLDGACSLPGLAGIALLQDPTLVWGA